MIEFLETDLPTQDTGLAFIYCDYKQKGSQSLENFIGALVTQLLRRHSTIPVDVRNLHEKHRAKGTPPGYNEYLDLLQSLTKGLAEMSLLVDALDECIHQDGESLWSGLLDGVKANVPNLRLLCTSRHISDMGERLGDSTHIEIRADNKDIRTYVLAQIKSRNRLLGFCTKDAALENNILEAITSNAAGM